MLISLILIALQGQKSDMPSCFWKKERDSSLKKRGQL